MVDKLKALYESGMSYEQIGRQFGRSKSWAMRMLRGVVISRPAIRKTVQHSTITWDTKQERDELTCKLYKSGMGARRISKKLSIGKRTVYKILAARGVSTDPARIFRKINKDTATKMYAGGKSISDIATLLGVNEEAVRKAITIQRRNAHDSLSVIPIDMQEQVIKWARDEKLSSYAIASKLGLPYQYVQRFLKRHKLSPGAFTKEWKEAVQRGIHAGGSSLEKRLGEILSKHNIRYTTQHQVEEFRFDFNIIPITIQGDSNVLVEVQGSYWHSKKQRIQRDIYKQKVAARNGYKLVVIWDYELSNEELVIARICNKLTDVVFNFKQCIIETGNIAAAKELLTKWHYQKYGRISLAITAHFDGKAVAAITFSSVTRLETAIKQGVKPSEILELSRLVIDPIYQAHNFATWFIARAIRLVPADIKVLVSFADPTFGHNGGIYRAANWTYDGIAPASYWYYHRRKNRIWHKKSIWCQAKKHNMSENEYAKSHQLLKVHGQPKSRFLYIKP